MFDVSSPMKRSCTPNPSKRLPDKLQCIWSRQLTKQPVVVVTPPNQTVVTAASETTRCCGHSTESTVVTAVSETAGRTHSRQLAKQPVRCCGDSTESNSCCGDSTESNGSGQHVVTAVSETARCCGDSTESNSGHGSCRGNPVVVVTPLNQTEVTAASETTRCCGDSTESNCGHGSVCVLVDEPGGMAPAPKEEKKSKLGQQQNCSVLNKLS
ncbi:hypothetical protein RRG08_032340 [Elysia crispata]|uniref:Uncharacterized protein n=1 Tax=Elysia crispata TaxID=231223 RepID=A0AAE1A3G7_9GAST|nr:hypothetical protein RRG08_032340 [Elysia crispata]